MNRCITVLVLLVVQFSVATAQSPSTTSLVPHCPHMVGEEVIPEFDGCASCDPTRCGEVPFPNPTPWGPWLGQTNTDETVLEPPLPAKCEQFFCAVYHTPAGDQGPLQTRFCECGRPCSSPSLNQLQANGCHRVVNSLGAPIGQLSSFSSPHTVSCLTDTAKICGDHPAVLVNGAGSLVGLIQTCSGLEVRCSAN